MIYAILKRIRARKRALARRQKVAKMYAMINEWRNEIDKED